MDTRAFVVALLLCLAPVAGSVAVADSPAFPQQTAENRTGTMVVFPAENTSEYLAPPADRLDRTDESAATLDVATAVEADAGELRAAYDAGGVRQRYEAADSDAEREAILEAGAETLSNEVEGLTARETAAVQRYGDGTIGTDELLRRLAVIGREAERIAKGLRWIETTAESIDADEIADRAAAARVRLTPLRGPVRSEVATAVDGDGAERVHVETAGNGIVLAAVSDIGNTYRREAHDPSARTTDVGDTYDGNPAPALGRFEELYPWAIESFEAIDATGPEPFRLYRFRASHDHGELETYLDSGSTEILHERQEIDAAAMPARTITTADGDLRLVANATRGGGPLGIAVEADGEPVDAAVTVNGDPVGSTDGGELWTVAPRGATTINATYDGESVELSTVLE